MYSVGKGSGCPPTERGDITKGKGLRLNGNSPLHDAVDDGSLDIVNCLFLEELTCLCVIK